MASEESSLGSRESGSDTDTQCSHCGHTAHTEADHCQQCGSALSGPAAQDSGVSTPQVAHQASTEGIRLTEGESVIENFQPKLLLWHQALGLGAVLVLSSVALAVDAGFGPRLLPSLGLGVVFIQLALYIKQNSRYVITDNRITAAHGVLMPDNGEIRIDTIGDVKIHRGVLPRLLGYATIVISPIEDSESDYSTFKMRGCGNPDHIADSIRTQMDANRDEQSTSQ